MDLWFLFACRGIDLLKKNGRLSFIATNNWISNYGASKFRNKILKTTKIEEYIDFGEYFIFDSANVLTMIFTLKKTENIDDYYCEYSKILDKTINGALQGYGKLMLPTVSLGCRSYCKTYFKFSFSSNTSNRSKWCSMGICCMSLSCVYNSNNIFKKNNKA